MGEGVDGVFWTRERGVERVGDGAERLGKGSGSGTEGERGSGGYRNDCGFGADGRVAYGSLSGCRSFHWGVGDFGANGPVESSVIL